jgi:superfamily II DNA/RNA helicase
VLETFGSHIGVTLVIGESQANIDAAHILITVPGFLYNKLTSRKVNLDFSHLKLVVYDEADELLI